MNILQILPELKVGGVETGTVDFAKYLVEHGHKSVVVSNGGELVDTLTRTGSKHYVLPVHRKSIISVIKLIKPLRRIIKEENIDIVHARSRVPAWIAFFACRKTKAEFITTCHGAYQNRLFSQVMGWSKLIIVPSNAIGKHMIDRYKVDRSNIRCIPRSVDLNRFNIKRIEKTGKPEIVISILGRITPLKGHTYFIKAMAKVVRSYPFVKIWIIGDAPENKQSYKRELEVLVRSLGLRGNVEFLGNRQDVPELLSKTDIMVMSTVTPEAFGRVILEAQAIGVPVVATSVGGIVDIIEDEKTGLLVMPRDVDQMAKQVMRLINDKNLYKSIVHEARLLLEEKFTLGHMATNILEVYKELLEYHNILVIKISAVGDIVLITASLKAIREKFPKAKIYCLVGKESIKILQNCPIIDGLIAYDHKKFDNGFLSLFNMAKKLRNLRIDKVIDFQNNKKSHLLAFLTFPRRSYGYNNKKWGFLLTDKVKNPKVEMPAVEHQFQLLNLLGIKYKEKYDLDLWPSKNDQNYVKQLFDEEWLGNTKNIVGINLAASEKWKSKNWSIEYTAKLCDMLSLKNIRVVVTGMEKDIVLVNQLKSLAKTKIASFAGKTDVMQLAAVIKRCKVFITPDSAPLHIAAAVKTPIIVFFGPTSSARHIPPSKSLIVLEKDLNCQSCYSCECKIMTHDCMNLITPEEVLAKVENIIEAKK